MTRPTTTAWVRLLMGATVTATLAGLAYVTAASPVAGPAVAGPAVAAPPGAGRPAARGTLGLLSERPWPMYGGTPQRNMVNTAERNLPDTWDVEKGTSIKWVVELGSQSYGNPTIAGGRIFVGTNNGAPRNPKIKGDKGVVMCLRESDGQFLWQLVHDKLPSGRVNDWPEQGICSSPYIEGDRIYYVSNRCELVCATVDGLKAGNVGVKDEAYQDPTEGDVVWRLDMMKELGVFPHNLAVCSPVVMGDFIFIMTGNGHDESHENIPAPEAPSFICVSKQTGKVIWTDNSPGERILHGQWSNPAYAIVAGRPQVVFAAGDGWVRSFEPATGKLIWKFDCNPKSAVYKLGGKGTRNYIIATPVVVDGKVYINTGQDPEHGDGVGHLWCIDAAKTGDVSVRNDNFNPMAPENKDSALVWHVGGQDKDGELLWHRSMSTVAIHEGLCYACTLHGLLTCFDAATGQKLWEHDTLSNVWGSPYYADGKVYLGTEEGDVLVFAHGREKKQLGKHDMKGSVLSTCVAADGVLYVMTKSRLYAIQKK